MKIEWTEPAIQDLESICQFIRRDSQFYAARFAERILVAVDKLAEFPEIGRLVPESRSKIIREIIFYNYRIMYRVESQRVVNPHSYSWIERGTSIEIETVGDYLRSY